MIVITRSLVKFMKSEFRRYSRNSIPLKKAFKHIDADPCFIRNIGILAHIDAGKTTTTERMLFYSGKIEHMGEVHHGNTVTDFMAQERERGITISSASVTFPWKNCSINLVDTPGHIDFTMEVEQTLNVIDSAIIVLDGSAGVEAQTLTVWRQANKYKIPCIIYINKMDRSDAIFSDTLLSIKKKLHQTPLPIQIPYYDGNSFSGVIDLLTMHKFIWKSKTLGTEYLKTALSPETDKKMWEEAVSFRLKLIEALADLDDKLAEIIILEEISLETISEQVLKDAIKRIILNRTGTVVLCGSSYKNIGVQLLLDCVTEYLPSPLECLKSRVNSRLNGELCAQAFKVRHDPHKGPITFFRVYSGRLKKAQKIFNLNQDKPELVSKLFMAYADDFEEVTEIGMGNIAAVAGLKHTVTGDLITQTASTASAIKKELLIQPEPILSVTSVPEPVFFCAIEPPSQAYQAQFERALSELSREDPSLRVSFNSETGQTELSGMGELHLDVIKERIRSDYKVHVELGPLQIAYKETLVNPTKDSHSVSFTIGGSQHSVNLVMSVFATEEKNGDILKFDRSRESASNIDGIIPKHKLSIKKGIEDALSRGPKLACPVINVGVILHWLETGRGTADTVIRSAAAQCVQKLLTQGGTKLLEPIMNLEVVTLEEHMSSVIADMSRRRATIQNVYFRGADKVLEANVPLSELLGYATFLRSITSGHASFSMEFMSLQEMSLNDEAKAIKSVTGLDPL